MKCDQCDSCYINGVFCHEHGCPNIKREQLEMDQDEFDESCESEGWS